MKYVVVLCDGCADLPIEELGGKTPLEAAHTPNMDMLARRSEIGMIKTVPDGMKPGSDTANLSALGYDPRVCYTGRSPLEAVSMGITLSDSDVTFRANLVTLGEGGFDGGVMADYSAGEISTEESRQLIDFLAQKLNGEGLKLYPGVSYRHCLVWDGGSTDVTLTPPHDILGKCVTEYMPKGVGADKLTELMLKSKELLHDHPVNVARRAAGKNTADSLWIWGEGTKPAIPDFYTLRGLKGAVISAVDLIKGIGISGAMTSIDVEGATGTVDTNFPGKAQAALDALCGGYDFVFIHMEAPDECGHQADAQGKKRSLELIDEQVLGKLLADLYKTGDDYRILLMPDHPTPVSIRTHTGDPVPYMIYDSTKDLGNGALLYNEKAAADTHCFIPDGVALMERFLSK